MSRYTADPNTLFPNGRSQENNPSAMFSQMTYPIQQNANMASFKKAFLPNEPLIERQNFRNQNNIIHNNVHNDIQSEFIVDYTLDIDSKDREISAYPDPFKYNVVFAPVPVGVERKQEWIDPKNKSLGQRVVSTIYNGPPPPYITKSMKNIKYIRVDSVILPKYYGIQYDVGLDEWILDQSKDLSKDRYVVMKIKNLESKFNLSTNTVVESNGIKLIPDNIMLGSNFFYAVPGNAHNYIKTYNMSLLGNLDRLYIEFYDSTGNLLKFNNLDPEQEITDVRNPLNVNLQNNITMVFGVVENEVATEVKFSS